MPGGAFQNLDSIGTPGAFGRGGDNGVNLFGIQDAVANQRFRNREGFRFGKAKQQTSVDCGVHSRHGNGTQSCRAGSRPSALATSRIRPQSTSVKPSLIFAARSRAPSLSNSERFFCLAPSFPFSGFLAGGSVSVNERLRHAGQSSVTKKAPEPDHG
jgi:hypothetical protein